MAVGCQLHALVSLFSKKMAGGRVRLKCDGTRAETRFRLSAKRTSPFKSAGASVQWTTDSRGVRISGSNAGYTMFRGSVKSTGYPLHLPVSPSFPLPCVTVCHHISAGLYPLLMWQVGRIELPEPFGTPEKRYLLPRSSDFLAVASLLHRRNRDGCLGVPRS
jgi:hypothetical protein